MNERNEAIRKQFTDVIYYSQKDCFNQHIDLSFEELFNQWWKNKTRIRQMLPFFADGNLIYEYPKPVSFGLDEGTKQDRLNRFVKELWDFPVLQDFLRENKANFFENRIVKDYKAPYGTARRGMKIIKAFKLFFNLDKDTETLKHLQAEASAIMNEDKITGTFCISIHPLDYISISDNDHNWHTCHSMDSDFRVGNFNYMADKHTVVCYVKTGEDRKIDNFPENVPWNSKKWRVLLFFDKETNFVMASKQYPLQSDEALGFFQKAFESAHKNADGSPKFTMCSKYSPWHKEQIDKITIDGHEYKFPKPMIPVGHHMASIDEIFVPGENTQQYNDILRNSAYNKEVRYCHLISNQSWHIFKDAGAVYEDNYRTSKHLFKDTELPLIEAGEAVSCPRCGLDIVRTGDAILCDNCVLEFYRPELLDEDYFPTCDLCGNKFIHYNGFWRDGQHICEDCAHYWDQAEDYEEEC